MRAIPIRNPRRLGVLLTLVGIALLSAGWLAWITRDQGRIFGDVTCEGWGSGA